MEAFIQWVGPPSGTADHLPMRKFMAASMAALL